MSKDSEMAYAFLRTQRIIAEATLSGIKEAIDELILEEKAETGRERCDCGRWGTDDPVTLETALCNNACRMEFDDDEEHE